MSHPFADLSAFQRDVLVVVAALEEPTFDDVQQELESSYRNVPDDRVSANLQSLVDDGYLEQSRRDDSETEYAVTDHGSQTIRAYVAWVTDATDE